MQPAPSKRDGPSESLFDHYEPRAVAGVDAKPGFPAGCRSGAEAPVVPNARSLSPEVPEWRALQIGRIFGSAVHGVGAVTEGSDRGRIVLEPQEADGSLARSSAQGMAGGHFEQRATPPGGRQPSLPTGEPEGAATF